MSDLRLVICVLFVIIRTFFYIKKKLAITKKTQARTAIVLGSGGHTSEMLRLLSALDLSVYSPRTYYLAETDKFSKEKLQEFEKDRTDYRVLQIPRAREVGQSYVSSVMTTVRAVAACVVPVIQNQVDVLLVNGPGTCVPVALLHFFINPAAQMIYVESICRVVTLSMSGRILRWFATSTLVQWPELADKYRGTTYIGRIL